MKMKTIGRVVAIFLTGISLGALGGERSVMYEITFTNNWNATDHVTFPKNAHYSPIVAVSHSNSYELFRVGAHSSSGFENLAEIGDTSILLSEIQEAQKHNYISDAVITAPLFPHRDGNTISFFVTVNERTPLLSFATMIAPSPDWVVGVSNLNTFVNGAFVEAASFDLHAINAGTEEGDFAGNFNTNNQPTSPREPISLLDGIAGLHVPFAFVEIRKVN